MQNKTFSEFRHFSAAMLILIFVVTQIISQRGWKIKIIFFKNVTYRCTTSTENNSQPTFPLLGNARFSSEAILIFPSCLKAHDYFHFYAKSVEEDGVGIASYEKSCAPMHPYTRRLNNLKNRLYIFQPPAIYYHYLITKIILSTLQPKNVEIQKRSYSA